MGLGTCRGHVLLVRAISAWQLPLPHDFAPQELMFLLPSLFPYTAFHRRVRRGRKCRIGLTKLTLDCNTDRLNVCTSCSESCWFVYCDVEVGLLVSEIAMGEQVKARTKHIPFDLPISREHAIFARYRPSEVVVDVQRACCIAVMTWLQMSVNSRACDTCPFGLMVEQESGWVG